MLLEFFSKLKAYAHVLVERWLKELWAQVVHSEVLLSCGAGVRGGQLCLCSTGHVTWWLISAVFLQLLRDGPFRALLQTPCGKSSKAHKWNAYIKPNNEALCSWAESCSSHWWSPHLPHNFILLAIAPSPPPPSHLYCEFLWTEAHYLSHVNSWHWGNVG